MAGRRRKEQLLPDQMQRVWEEIREKLNAYAVCVSKSEQGGTDCAGHHEFGKMFSEWWARKGNAYFPAEMPAHTPTPGGSDREVSLELAESESNG